MYPLDLNRHKLPLYYPYYPAIVYTVYKKKGKQKGAGAGSPSVAAPANKMDYYTLKYFERTGVDEGTVS
jgi:hypothetical protein